MHKSVAISSCYPKIMVVLNMKNGKKTSDYWDGTITSENKPLRLKIRNVCGDETVFVI